MRSPTFRFAPSPNGYLHLGHALSALLNFEMARAADGRFILRIEDIDQARCRPHYEEAIYEDLAWLGIRWEEPVRRQSEHLDDYRAAIAKLYAQGLLYPSFESRAEIAELVGRREAKGPWPRDPDGVPLYTGEARGLPQEERNRRILAGDRYASRLDMAAAIERARALAGPLTWNERGSGPDGETNVVTAKPEVWGDVVIGRKETPTSYHLSVVVDDALQGVTHVVRGEDLFWSTSVHRLLQVLLGLPEPIYRHHRLMLDADGRKLAKSTEATALRALRQQGLSPRDIRNMIGLL